MSEWKARRFWKAASARPAEGGWEIWLDERPLRTPGKSPLIVPTQVLAAKIAEEWDAQTDEIDPNVMPLTRSANSAIEKLRPQFDAVVSMLAEYGATDLLCYRATHPEPLVQLQAEAWDPLIDWVAREFSAPLVITHGVIPVQQDLAALARLHQVLAAQDVFVLTAVHDLITLPGSLVLGLAVLHGRISPEQAHDFAQIDEEFQASRWGRDEEADQAAAARKQAILHAAQFLSLSRQESAGM